jgi:hypothetical protein
MIVMIIARSTREQKSAMAMAPGTEGSLNSLHT